MIKALREKKAKAVADAKAILEATDAESRAMTSEEDARFEAFMSEADALDKQINQRTKLEDAERALNESQGRKTAETRSNTSDEDALRGWLSMGAPGIERTDTVMRSMASAERAGLAGKSLVFDWRNDPLTYGEDFRSWQSRAQSVGTNTAGGYLVAQGFSGELEKALLALGGVRQVARILRTANGADIPWPTVNDSSHKAVIITENTEMSDASVTFGDVVLKSVKYTSGIVKVSLELLQDSAVNLPQVVSGLLADSMFRGTNEHFTTGNGTTQPQGVITGAHAGVTGASATSITYDELVDMEHSIDSSYRNGAVWMMSDTSVRDIKKIKDSDGKSIWLPSLAAGTPDRILGYPFVVNNDVADMAAGAKSILFGNFSKFIVRDAGPVTLTRLDERYAEFGQVAFVSLSRHWSSVIDAGTHPIAYFTNAAS